MTTTIALAGKGGVGKTTISAMVIKYLAQTQPGAVLAIDADPSSNLYMTLGLQMEWTVGDIREGLLDLRAAVHHKRAVPHHRLGERFAAHQEDLCVHFRLQSDSLACAGEDGQVAFTCFTLTVQDDFAAQHKNRGRVAVWSRQLRRFAGAEIHIPQADGCECLRRTFVPVKFPGNDAHSSGVLRQRHTRNHYGYGYQAAS